MIRDIIWNIKSGGTIKSMFLNSILNSRRHRRRILTVLQVPVLQRLRTAPCPLTEIFISLLQMKTWFFREHWSIICPASSGGFVQYTKKNVMQLFPQNEDEIKAYLKSNKINFSKT